MLLLFFKSITNNVYQYVMFSRQITEEFVLKSRTIDKVFPISYCHLFGTDRLAILPILSEELKTKLHMIIQQKVDIGTTCIRNDCEGVLDTLGSCSNNCEQFGKNIVDDIICCSNCDQSCFPCQNCSSSIFHNQLKTNLEDY